MVGLVMASLILFGMTAVAQTNLSFLTSKGALRAYAVEQAVTACGQLSAPTQVGNQINSWGNILNTNHTSADILSTYANKLLSITILNPKDQIYLNAWVLNGDGDALFYGGTGTYPVYSKGGGGYVLPQLSVKLILASVIPVKFNKPVSNADIVYTDPVTGQTANYQQLASNGNKVYFPTDSAGKGFLQVNFTDGTQMSYDIHTGAGGADTGISVPEQTWTESTIDNLVQYKDPWTYGVVNTLQSSQGIGLNRTYELILSSKGYVGFQLNTSEGANATGYWYRTFGSQNWLYVPAINGIGQIPVTSAGTWYVVPDWDPSQFREPDPVISSLNGKG